ncbi:hypothetical protein GCM10010156_48640 [Planobispora rosea]|uniref:Major facilitator superfamily (MFS) profile domain-containing protein n=1 Tax=Planobispora rosea TaxID=35762 RepID=A0A8J3WEH1_PLARO|nr:MFS transporter [Planobispora rosea]GGS84307.1 hypothetical protein GCM10010156_48640 [Planobispora rosea]GIH86375.1 hypothetical protein Pro02_47830 [Planobispora rosea]
MNRPAAPLRPGYGGRLSVLILAIACPNATHTALIVFLPELAADWHLSPALLATFLMIDPLAKIALQPVGGRAVDRWGPYAVLPVSMAISTAGVAALLFTHDPYAAIAARALWGAGTGAATPAAYRIASLLAGRSGVPEAQLFSWFAAGATAAMAAGPPIAGAISAFAGYRHVLAGAIVLGVVGVTAALIWLRLPAPAPAAAATPPAAAAAAAASADRKGRWPYWTPVLVFGGFDLLVNASWAAIEPLVPLSTTAHSPALASGVLTAGLVAFVIATPVLGRLPARYRTPSWGVAALAAMALPLLGLAEPAHLLVSIPSMITFTVIQALAYLVARDGLARYSDSSGRAFGLFGALGDGGYLLGPAVGIAAHSALGSGAFAALAAGTLAGAGVFAVAIGSLHAGRHRRSHARPSGRAAGPAPAPAPVPLAAPVFAAAVPPHPHDGGLRPALVHLNDLCQAFLHRYPPPVSAAELAGASGRP